MIGVTLSASNARTHHQTNLDGMRQTVPQKLSDRTPPSCAACVEDHANMQAFEVGMDGTMDMKTKSETGFTNSAV